MNHEAKTEVACTIELDDKTVIELCGKKWNEVIKSGLRTCGYIENQKIIDKFYQALSDLIPVCFCLVPAA